MRKTKILVTVGPSCNNSEMIEKLIQAGVNVFRLNFSHSNHDEHKITLQTIREVSKKLNKSVGILQDISGPKIRIGDLREPLNLKEEDTLCFCREDGELGLNEVKLNHPKVLDSLKVDDLIYLADGTIRVKVVKIEPEKVTTKVLVGGELTSRKGVNFPSTKLDIPAITKKDISDIMFGIENEVDFMALSFVQSPQDVLTAKDIIKSYGKEIPIFAKIEKQDAVKRIDEIIEVSDGIMVARGDMGVELGVDKVPKVQKMIIKKANEAAKPVITATQMLTSMINSPYPTRAEISDVANAVLDGTDAVMLSDETAVGNYPIKAVEVLDSAIKDIETIYSYHMSFEKNTLEEALAISANNLANLINPNGIIIFTKSGKSATAIAKYRPKADIIVNCCDERIFRQLSIYWGISPTYILEKVNSSDELVHNFIEKALADKVISIDETYILLVGYQTNKSGSTNLIRLLNKDEIEYLMEKFN